VLGFAPMHPALRAALFVSALAPLACGREVPPPKAALPTAAETPTPAPSVAEAERPSPALEVRSMEGSAGEGARKALGGVGEALRRCEAGKGLVLAMTLRGEGDDARLDIEPGTGIEVALRRCVMEAISTADFPEVLDQPTGTSSASSEPRRFAAQLVVRW
jgi:hypothetical protein